MNLYAQHPELVAYLSENLRGGALHYILAKHEPALVSWLDSIADDGSLEISARYSANRSPLVSNWPQYAMDRQGKPPADS